MSMTFKHVRRIEVSIWNRHVGTIVPAPAHGFYAFKYDPAFVRSGLEIAPLMMPLRDEPYMFADLPRNEYEGLPPVFADSLPDGFGSGLIDRWMKERGVSPDEITPLDRLAYVGRRGMGALCYEPDRGPGGRPTSLDMRGLVEEARRAVNGELAGQAGDEALRTIIRIGSTAGGAQAKALVGWNRTTGEFLLGDCDLPDGFEHWIVKFTPKDYPWRGEREYELYRKACASGIRMNESVLYELDGMKHFMTKRFDRAGNVRRHLSTLSAVAHFPMSVPLAFRSYGQLLATVDELGLGYEVKEEAFRRIVFNVLADECDDHTRNFSFVMDEDGQWQLAPAYDLTGSAFPSEDPWSAHGGTHQLSVNGKFSHITDGDLLQVSDRYAIGTGKKVLARVKEAFAE